MAAVRPPRGLTTNSEFLRLSTTRLISTLASTVVDGHRAIATEHAQLRPLAQGVGDRLSHGMAGQQLLLPG